MADKQRKTSTARTRTGAWRQEFLDALSTLAHVERACKVAQIEKRTAYNHRRKDPEFRKNWDKALKDAVPVLENEAMRRAIYGVRKPVYQQKELVGFVREYSDTLLIFMLKGLKPARYRDKYTVDINARSNIEKKIKELGITPEQIDADPSLAQILAALGISIHSAATSGSAT